MVHAGIDTEQQQKLSLAINTEQQQPNATSAINAGQQEKQP